MARAIAILGAATAALVLGWVLVIGPFLSAPAEDLVSTPGLAGLYERQEVRVPPGGKACTRDVFLTKPADRVRYLVAGKLRRTDGIRLSTSGTSFRAAGGRPQADAAGADSFLTIPFSPAAEQRASRVRICLNAGRRALSLVGTSEGNSAVVASTSINGRRTVVDIALRVLGGRQVSRWDTLREVPDRIAAATGVLSGTLVAGLALLVVLLLLGVPVGALLAVDRSTQRD